jgi:hypothetical protein
LSRNCLLKYVIEGKIEGTIEVTGRRGRRRKQLLDRSWIGHIMSRNCLLKHDIEGQIEGRTEVTARLGRRRKQVPDDLKETGGCWKLKEKALDLTP